MTLQHPVFAKILGYVRRLKRDTMTLQHPVSGVKKDFPSGFSYTTLCFSFFVPLVRRDLTWAGLMFLADGVLATIVFLATIVDIAILLPFLCFVLIITRLAFSFFYNKKYIQKMQKKGWK